MFGGRIPFLNGGLFEPEYDYKDVSSRIFLNNQTFETVFSVFEKYNFTVKEDEPLDKEVAIDPEMLAKVFENLLDQDHHIALVKGDVASDEPVMVCVRCKQSLNSKYQFNDSFVRPVFLPPTVSIYLCLKIRYGFRGRAI